MRNVTRPLVTMYVPDATVWRVAQVTIGVALLAISAQLQIPLPFSPVPVTAQTFAVLLIGATYGARLGAATTLVYVLAGATGLPIYAGAVGGVVRLAGPTGGYLAGFVVAAAIVGALAERGWTGDLPRALAAMAAGEVAIYAFGLAWLARFPLPVGVLDAGLIPFIPGDLFKIALATVALPLATRALRPPTLG